LIADSLNQYDYEIWIESKNNSPLTLLLVPFDTTLTLWDNYTFNLKLIIKNQNTKIDSLSQLFKARLFGSVESYDDLKSLPLTPNLNQNFPNPFNSKTLIKFTVPYSMEVNISIYNITGQSIETLTNELYQPGAYFIYWDASHINSGIYFIKLNGGGFSSVRKCSLIK